MKTYRFEFEGAFNNIECEAMYDYEEAVMGDESHPSYPAGVVVNNIIRVKDRKHVMHIIERILGTEFIDDLAETILQYEEDKRDFYELCGEDF